MTVLSRLLVGTSPPQQHVQGVPVQQQAPARRSAANAGLHAHKRMSAKMVTRAAVLDQVLFVHHQTQAWAQLSFLQVYIDFLDRAGDNIASARCGLESA